LIKNSAHIWEQNLSQLPNSSMFKAALSILLLFNSAFLFTAFAGDDKTSKPLRKYYTTRLITMQPVIDGILDDQCWGTGEWTGDFVQWIPNEGAKPTKPTYLKILYDDKNIYAAFKVIDDPDKITMKAGRRDELNGDMVGINFDSYHDRRTGFEFTVTAAGQKIDLILTNPMNGDVSWNAVWYVKTAMNDSGWTAEFEIPLSQLRYSSADEQVWGMHVWRWIDRLQEESDWEPQSLQGPGMLYLFGELHGIKGLPDSRRIEIMPYTLGELNTFKKEPGNPFADKGRSWLGNIGLDAKLGLSSNFTADVTINPDFGQVESDPSVMNLTAFETFYEERRPFFLEGKNIFSFDFDDINLFYSRRIGHTPGFTPELLTNQYIDVPDNTTILEAVKVSGKTAKGLSVGILQSLTANEKARLNTGGKESDLSIEPLSNYFITRIQQDFDEGNSVVGGIFTTAKKFINDRHLEFMNRGAYTGGVDLIHQWNNKEFFVDAKFVGSYIKGTNLSTSILQNSAARYYQRPDADHVEFDSSASSLSGYGGKIRIGKGSIGRWRYSTELNWRSPGLDLNDLGYMQTSDIIKQNNRVSYFINQPVSIFRTYTIELEQFNNWDFGMNHLSSGAGLRFYAEFTNNWMINNRITFTSRKLDTRLLRGGSAMFIPATLAYNIYGRTDPSRKIFFDFIGNASVSGNQNSRYYSIQPGISVMPLNTLKVSVSVNYFANTDRLQYIEAQKNTYILGKLSQQTLGVTFRIDYNITPELSIQYYGSPFASAGEFSEFKLVTDPKADNYSDRFLTFNPLVTGNEYRFYDQISDRLSSFYNPDFNFSQFRSNLVLRWEYRPGSQLFLIWSSERTHYENPSAGSVNDALSRIKNVYPGNIFLVKFNYWFTI